MEEVIVGIVAAVGALAGGLATPYVTGRFERTRQERALAAELRKDLIAQRRQLLDQGALLLVDVEETLQRLLTEIDDQEAPARNWENLRKRLDRFDARVGLWFDEDAKVVSEFKKVVEGMQRVDVSSIGRDRADIGLRTVMIEQLQSGELKETDRSKMRENIAKVDQRLEERRERREKARGQVDGTRRAFQRLAQVYLAGDVRGGRRDQPVTRPEPDRS
jgi:hypothetical protein